VGILILGGRGSEEDDTRDDSASAPAATPPSSDFEFQEHVAVGFNLSAGHFFIDRTHCGSSTEPPVTTQDIRAAPLRSDEGGEQSDLLTATNDNTLRLHMYIDHSIVSVILNNRTAITIEAFPLSAASTRIGLYALKKDAAGANDGVGEGSTSSKSSPGFSPSSLSDTSGCAVDLKAWKIKDVYHDKA